MSPLRNAWKHFPNKKGLISGLIMMGFGFSSIIFNYISDEIINPEESKVLDNHLYSEEIANRVPTYISVVVKIFIFVGITVITFLFPAREEKFQSDKRIEFLSVIKLLIYLGFFFCYGFIARGK